MVNFIEKGGKQIENRKETQAVLTGIFYSAKDLLEKKGVLAYDGEFPFFRYMVFNHIEYVRGQEVLVEISAGTDLEKARKMSVRIQEIGLLEVRKKGLRGEEEFSAREWKGKREPNFFYLGARDLDGSQRCHIRDLNGYYEAIMGIRKK